MSGQRRTPSHGGGGRRRGPAGRPVRPVRWWPVVLLVAVVTLAGLAGTGATRGPHTVLRTVNHLVGDGDARCAPRLPPSSECHRP